jgi:hypothetical protein
VDAPGNTNYVMTSEGNWWFLLRNTSVTVISNSIQANAAPTGTASSAKATFLFFPV